MIELKSGSLRVEISEPDSEYSGVRFDRMGFISAVYAKNERITAEYYEGSRFVGSGLCNEFGITRPVGYKSGGWFIKIGVGLLKADNEPYSFMKNYKCLPGRSRFKKTSQTTADFVMEAKTGEFGILYRKTITLDGDGIKIGYTLENTGKKAIETDEYAHNFLKLKPGYKTIAAPVSDAPEQRIKAENNTLSIPYGESESYICRFKARNPDGFSWHISGSGTEICERAHFRTEDFSVWKTDGIISPEIICDIRIEPNGTKKWEREYAFKVRQEGRNV